MTLRISTIKKDLQKTKSNQFLIFKKIMENFNRKKTIVIVMGSADFLADTNIEC